MIVKDLRKEFYPVPKSGQKKIKQDSKKEQKKDFCIMPKNNSYSTEEQKYIVKDTRFIFQRLIDRRV